MNSTRKPKRSKAQAERRGIPPGQFAGEFLRENLPPQPSDSDTLTSEEFHTMLRELAEGSEALPKLPTSAFSRESIDQDHL